MNYNYTSDMKYAKIVADKANLGLIIDSSNPQPRTDGAVIYLPPLDPMWDKSSREYKDWWYALLHECFHNLHPEDFTLIKDKEIDTRSFLGTILNIALDYKIETVNRGEFVGRDHLVHEARYAFAADKIYRMLGKPVPEDKLRPRLEAVWVMDALCRVPWIPEYKRDDLPGKLCREGQEWYVKLLQTPSLFELYQGQKSTEDSWDITLLILKVLELDLEDPEINEAPALTPSGEPEPKDSWVKFSECVADPHDDPSDREAGLHIEYDQLPPAEWVPLPVTEHCMQNEYVVSGLQDQAFVGQLQAGCANVNLSKKIRRELQSLARTRFEGGKKRGRIRSRDLFRAVAQDSDTVFRKRIVKFNPKSTSALVLCDFSGSMGGDKLKHAAVATHELSRVLHALMLPHSVYGFSTHSRKENLAFRLKGQNESFKSDTFLQRVVHASKHMHCNADGDFIHWAGGKLLRTKAARKILFVLSDGSPAAVDAHGNRGIFQFTQDVVKDLERMGIEIYAIGIEDRNVEEIYKHYATIRQASELEPKLLGVLRNKLIAGMV